MLLHPIITICSECAMLAILSYTDRATVIQLLTHSMRHASSDSIFTSPIPMVAWPWPDPFVSPDGPLTQEIALKRYGFLLHSESQCYCQPCPRVVYRLGINPKPRLPRCEPHLQTYSTKPRRPCSHAPSALNHFGYHRSTAAYV